LSIERGFASRPIEGASGLVYMRARHYDPTTGRFLQPDPEGIASTQRYAFAEHNPYIYNDPTGRSSRGIGSLDRGVPSWAFEGGGLLADSNLIDPFGPSGPEAGWGGYGGLDGVQAALDVLSLGLDATGFGSAVSWMPDVLNAGISLTRGDYTGAGLSATAAVPFIGAAANAARLRQLGTGGDRVANAGGAIRSFVTSQDRKFFRTFSGDATSGRFLTAISPRSSAFAQEALALPFGNKAEFLQEVLVPAGTRLQRSRVLPAWGRRGGAEQFELIDRIPFENFGPGAPLP
jgi:RHS repeat-associated protein